MTRSTPSPRLGPLQDATEQLRSQYGELATAWSETKADWTDNKAREFETQRLGPIGPVLSRLSATLTNLTQQVRRADNELQEPV